METTGKPQNLTVAGPYKTLIKGTLKGTLNENPVVEPYSTLKGEPSYRAALYETC